MAGMTNDNPEDNPLLKGPAKEFAAFCEADRAHRRNSDPAFNAELYEEAVALVLNRIAALRRDTRG
jgi:hypothetical protein